MLKRPVGKNFGQFIHNLRTKRNQSQTGFAISLNSDKWKTTSKIISETIKFVDGLKDDKIKVLSAWLHMNRELGTAFTKNRVNTQLYNIDSSAVKLSERAKVELANAVSAFIMNI